MIGPIVYAQFFALERLPFRLRPDAEFLYPGSGYRRARSSLQARLAEHAQVLLLLGGPGMGKTMLLDDVLARLDADCRQCRINQPQISVDELRQALALQWGASLDAVAADDRPALLAVDDAHLLPTPTAKGLNEILQRATNIKVLLSARTGCGMEENAVRYLSVQKAQVMHLDALGNDDARAYVEHRLTVAGGRNRQFIDPEAHALLFHLTGGAPRLLNVLCDAALHAACSRAAAQINTADLHSASRDARWTEALARDRSADAAAACTPDAARTPDAGHTARARLVVTLGNETVMTWPLLPGRTTIGRASDNDLRLETCFISRHHCHVTTMDSVSTIEDLHSVNGLIVNGKTVKRHVLEHADEVQLGRHKLTYLSI